MVAPFISGVLTDTYGDNEGEFDLSRFEKDGFLFIDYTKGTEASAEMKIEVPVDDADIPTVTTLFQEALDTAGVLTLKEYTLPAASAAIRIPVSMLQKNKKFKVSVKCTTPGGTPGNVKIYGKFEDKSFAPST